VLIRRPQPCSNNDNSEGYVNETFSVDKIVARRARVPGIAAGELILTSS
jgi:hypothetical protein